MRNCQSWRQDKCTGQVRIHFKIHADVLHTEFHICTVNSLWANLLQFQSWRQDKCTGQDQPDHALGNRANLLTKFHASTFSSLWFRSKLMSFSILETRQVYRSRSDILFCNVLFKSDRLIHFSKLCNKPFYNWNDNNTTQQHNKSNL